jgi:hypothetical protein
MIRYLALRWLFPLCCRSPEKEDERLIYVMVPVQARKGQNESALRQIYLQSLQRQISQWKLQKQQKRVGSTGISKFTHLIMTGGVTARTLHT